MAVPPEIQRVIDEAESARDVAKTAANEAETARNSAQAHSDAANEALRKAETGIWTKLSFAASCIAAIAAVAAAIVAFNQLSKITRDSRTSFSYEVFQDLSAELELFMEQASKSLAFSNEVKPFEPDGVGAEHANNLIDLFNTYFVLWELRQASSELIDNTRWERTTKYICESLQENAFANSLIYLDFEVSKNTPEHNALLELSACRK